MNVVFLDYDGDVSGRMEYMLSRVFENDDDNPLITKRSDVYEFSWR